jgi:hypothetical protein
MFNTLYRSVTGARGPALRRLIEELVNPEKKLIKYVKMLEVSLLISILLGLKQVINFRYTTNNI